MRSLLALLLLAACGSADVTLGPDPLAGVAGAYTLRLADGAAPRCTGALTIERAARSSPLASMDVSGTWACGARGGTFAGTVAGRDAVQLALEAGGAPAYDVAATLDGGAVRGRASWDGGACDFEAVRE